MRSLTLFTAAFVCILLLTIPARGGGGPECWRRGGPPAMAALMAEHADAIRRHREGQPVENWAKISADLDAVAAQRDAWASGLYWYTDLSEAQAQAKREGKPILSLRLLGRLDEELSCANSRFFRTTLYPAAEVSRRMRDNFILHWSSERPVPVVTVDYGDGRALRRTVTGNSAHYMMSGDGEVVDVLPGLYGAKPFAAWLDDAGDLAKRVAAAPAERRAEVLKAHHAARRDQLTVRWTAELGGAQSGAVPEPRGGGGAAPDARRAGALAVGKSFGERPLVALLARADPFDASDVIWARIAARHAADAALDPAAVAMIRSKRPSGDVDKAIAALEQAIAQDTVRNEYTLHRRVHEWFAGDNPPTKFEPLNQRVYAELFLTPRNDPWLGLAPADAWSGLEEDGLTSTATASAR